VTRLPAAVTLSLLVCATLVPGPGVARADPPGLRASGRLAAPARAGVSARASVAVVARKRSPARTERRRRAIRALRRVTSLPSETGLAQAAMLARVLATPCENTQLIPEVRNLQLVRASILCLINRERAANGEQPLKPNPKLEGAAEAHVHDMLAADYFEHVSPSGVTPVDRARAEGYIPGPSAGYVIGENLAWGTLSLATPEAIVCAWIASPPHLANILEGGYRDTGIAIDPQVPAALVDGVAGATYSQEFGSIIR
jgi:uncharacterized protein YkwD